MTDKMKSLLLFPALYLMLFLFTCSASADEKTITDCTVSTQSELADWLSDHEYTGGEVYLSAPVTITESITIYNTEPIVIHTGPYGFIFNGGDLSFNQSEIIGEGIQMPVVEIVYAGEFGWRNNIRYYTVTATGECGTAVRIARDDGWPYTEDIFRDLPQGIRALGEGGIGLELAENMDAYFLNISAPKGYAVKAEKGASIYYSRLEGYTDTAFNAGITLDTCNLTPGDSKASVIKRSNIASDLLTIHLPVQTGISDEGLNKVIQDIQMFYTNLPAVLNAESCEDTLLNLPVIWDYDSLKALDTSKPGTQEIYGELPPVYQGLGLVDSQPPRLFIDIKDPELPCIDSVIITEESDGYTIRLWNWLGKTWDISQLSLFSSNDGGKTWKDITASTNVSMSTMPDSSRVCTEIYMKELNHKILYQFKVPGVGEGNTSYVSPTGKYVYGGVEGDRTGIDREEVDPPLIGNDPNLQNTQDQESNDNRPPENTGQPVNSTLHQKSASVPDPSSSSSGGILSSLVSAVPEMTCSDQATGNYPSPESKSDSKGKTTPVISHKNNTALNYTVQKRSVFHFIPWILILTGAAAIIVLYICRQKGIIIRQYPLFYPAIFALVICITSAACCLLLYQYDNKYTLKGPQPAQGLLSLDKIQLQEYPVLYLTEDWEYYGNRLLTPTDFIKNPPVPDEYVFIGQHGGFERKGSPSPHGSASYRLCLSLPDAPQTYMLELPEIFSAYQLYVNDELMLEMGSTGTQSYRPETGSRTLTFTGSGNVSILIAVTDYSHLYSGMVYPPAFGQPEAVMAQSKMRLTLRSIICTAAAVIGLFALYIGITTKDRTLSLLYSLLCFLFIGYVGYPIWNTFASVYYGKYALENLCFCAMLTIVLLLQQNISAANYRLNRYMVFFGIFVCTITLVTHIALPTGALWIMRAYSYLIYAYEWSTAIFLTVTSVSALLKKQLKANPMFYGVLIFDCTLVMDRLFPLFEPVVTGWFIELGSFALILTLGLAILREVGKQYQLNAVLKERAYSAELLNKSRESYYTALKTQIEQTNAARHDLRHHFVAISGLIENHQYEELQHYMSDYNQSFGKNKVIKYCDNEVLNVLAHYFHQLARQNNVRLNMKVLLGSDIEVPGTDLSILLSNLLENGIEACLQLKEEERFIDLCIRQTDHILNIYMKNSTNETLQKDDHIFFADQRNQRGYGLVSVSDIARKYEGNAEFHFNQKTRTFYSSVSININEQICGI